MIAVTNAEFVKAIYGELSERERYWITAFSCTPEQENNPYWGGRATGKAADYPDKNAYVSTAVLQVIGGVIRKKRDYFARLPVVVLDDAHIENCSYALETSQGNFQVGFILRDPIRDELVAYRLQTALRGQKLVNADTNGYSSVRYIRLPVGYNNKNDPAWRCRLTKWQPERKFSLAELCEMFGLDLGYILNGTGSAEKKPSVPALPTDSVDDTIQAGPDKLSMGDCVSMIVAGESFHDPINTLACQMAAFGAPVAKCVEFIEALVKAAPDQDTDRWKSRFADIGRSVRTGYEKFSVQEQAWPEIVDPFAQYAVPQFPLDALPPAFARLCEEGAAGSGFDPGAYGFSLLTTAASLIDHRHRIRCGVLSTPAFLWGGLVGDSGAGKSPVMAAALSGAREIDSGMVRQSQEAAGRWMSAMSQIGRKKGPPTRRPAWRQIIVRDTTVEALAKLLQDNPEGVLLAHDEITEFIGRMDCYSGGAGSGKDRGVYLRAFDGGPETVHRASKETPMVIEHFSVGILAGIQPGKLADLFKKAGGGSDGLFQRFMMYAMRAPGKVDYSARVQPQTQAAVDTLLRRLRDRSDDLFGGDGNADLCDEAVQMMQEYHQAMRDLASHTASERLKEHLNKFPGFLARIAFTLHRLECAAREETRGIVTVDTFLKARRIIDCLYHHSAAVYEVLDQQAGEVSRLVKSAAEAILSKGWPDLQRGDLTREATYWREADPRAQEHAVALLEEFGWLRDVTPAAQALGRRGRRSLGAYVVNPAVHRRFSDEGTRIKQGRETRHAALLALGAKRIAEKEAN